MSRPTETCPPADVRDVLRLVEMFPGSELKFDEKHGAVLSFPSDDAAGWGDE